MRTPPQAAGNGPLHVNENARLEALKYMVLAGHGQAWLPRSLIERELDQGVLVAVDDRRSRLAGLQAGEAVMHNAERTAVVLVKADGSIEVTATVAVTVTAPVVRVIGNLEVTGNIVASGSVSDGVGSVQSMRDAYNNHGGHHLPGDNPDTVM